MAAKKKTAPKTKPTKPTKPKDVGSGKPRKDKLGVKANQRVHLVGTHDATVTKDVKALGASITDDVRDADWIFWSLTSPADLARMNSLRASMRDDASIWAVWPKGRPELKEDHIRDHALHIDLVDVKVMSWSDTLSGLKIVVRKSARK
jgi:hypothetical protein